MTQAKRICLLMSITAALLAVIGLGTQPAQTAGSQTIRNFIFGHSLIAHSPPLIPTPSNETTVPHWLHFLAEAGGHSYAVDGQYGFLLQHAQLPPNPQWGFEHVSGVWDVDSGATFADSDFTTVLLTAANFVQYQPATVPYDGDNPSQQSPVTATLSIVDWLVAQEPGIDIYIYENWPDMAGFINSFPPTSAEFAAYNAYTSGDFHDWWVDYHAAVSAARPAANVKMIPVGPILATLLTSPTLDQIPLSDLYEDDAPHGRPSLYFLASLISYMAIYDEQPADTFVVPATVHQTIRDNYTDIVADIWDELVDFGVVAQSPTQVQLLNTGSSLPPFALSIGLLAALGIATFAALRKRTQ